MGPNGISLLYIYIHINLGPNCWAASSTALGIWLARVARTHSGRLKDTVFVAYVRGSKSLQSRRRLDFFQEPCLAWSHVPCAFLVAQGGRSGKWLLPTL